MPSSKTTLPLRGSPPAEGKDSPSPKGWPAQPDGVVPKLRFPEFREAGDWGEGKLISLSNEPLSNGVFNDPKKVGVGYKLINVSDMYIDTAIDEGRLSLLELAKSDFEANQAKHGDIFFTRSSLVKSGIAVSNIYLGSSSDVTFDGHLIRFRANTNKVVPLFAHYLFKTTQIRAQLIARGKSATMTTIGQADVASVVLFYPEKKEQQKIADCLASLDERITLEAQKLDTLKTHKKGLMQQLFPAEGETLPKLRFPEFREEGAWGVLPFGEIAKFLSGGTPSKDVAEYWGGGIPWISASSMHSTKIEKSDSNITELAVFEGARIAKKGTLLLLVRGSMLHKRIPIGIAETDVAFNQDVKALELKTNITEQYLMYFLLASESKLLSAVTATGIGAGKLDTSDLNNFLVRVPLPTEQQKIADCLASLDDLITAQTQKLAALKTHKKGLMQQLFPFAVEVKE